MDNDCGVCMEHSGTVAKITMLEANDRAQWKAIDEIRADVKHLTWKIAGIVGSISLIQSVFVGVIVYYATRG